MQKVQSFLKSLAVSIASRPLLAKPLHTFWQTFLAALLVSAAGVHDLSTAKAVVLAALAAALSAAKTSALSQAGRS